MYADGIHVRAGDSVTAGQHIADVGIGRLLDRPASAFRDPAGGANAGPVDPEPWLAATGRPSLDCGCSHHRRLRERDEGRPVTRRPRTPGATPNHLVDDPTTDGQITARTAHVLAQVRATLPRHPRGRAGRRGSATSRSTRSAVPATARSATPSAPPRPGAALDLGWAVTNWLKANAQTLGVEYLIWQGRIWSVARSSEGWRPYDGGGMHDPAASPADTTTTCTSRWSCST